MIPSMYLICALFVLFSLLSKIQGYEIVFEKASGQVTLYVYDFPDFHARCLSHELPGPQQKSEQTCMLLDEPDKLVQDYTRLLTSAFYRFDDIAKDIKRVLMIGLGGGVLLRPLQHLVPDATIDVVEINPDMVRVARDYFSMKQTPNTCIHVEDGYKFIMRNATEQYDVIILDAFVYEKTPSSFRSRQFMESLKLSLSENGVAMSNVITSPTNPLFEQDVDLWKKTFGSFYGFSSDGNFVMTGRKSGKMEDFKTLAANARKIDLKK